MTVTDTVRSYSIICTPDSGIETLHCISSGGIGHSSLCFVFLWRIPRLSLIQHILYVGVVERAPPPSLIWGAVRKDGAEIPWGWSLPACFTSWGPRLFLIIQCRRQRHLTWAVTHDGLSREINLWKSFNLLLWSNLWPLAPSDWCLTASSRFVTPARCTNWHLKTMTIGLNSLFNIALRKSTAIEKAINRTAYIVNLKWTPVA